MKYIPALFIFFSLFACCPKITEVTQTRSYALPADTDTIYIDRLVQVPEAHSDTLQLDIKSICDSIYKGRYASFRQSAGAKGKPVAIVTIDSLGIASVFCNVEAYKDTLKDQQQLIVNLKTFIENNKTITTIPYWYNLFKYGFFIFGALLLLGIIAIITFK